MKFNPKNLFYILLTLLMVYVILRIIKFVSGGNSSVTNFRNDGTWNPTITENQAYSLAEQLYVAMRGYGTDEASINDVLRRINNLDDLRLIHNAFGQRKYNPVLGDSGETPLLYDSYSLRAWLESELTAQEFLPWKTLYDETYELF